MKLIFEKGAPGQGLSLMPPCDVPEITLSRPRTEPLDLPHVSETELTRHYTALAKRVHGVNDGFYPLGSCTMKYNPKINEDMASLPGFTQIHPLQPQETVQGCLEAIHTAGKLLGEITGMDAITFQPAAGAGFTVVNIPSGPDGCVDVEALRQAVGPDTAGLMLTNPNTVGIFDKNILEITKTVHEAGGLCYYDGANLNTFSTPHGGGGPGSGAVGCKEFLARFLPGPVAEKDGDGYRLVRPEDSIGRVKNFYGNFAVAVRALTYVLTLGREGIPEAAKNAVLNANYMMKRLSEKYAMAYAGPCMHEFVMTLQDLKDETGCSAMDVAKGLLDHGIHPPTMYFPLIVHEALMVEPTETESQETMDEVCGVFLSLWDLAHENPQALHDAPTRTPVGRLDEVGAARNPVLRYLPHD